MIQFQFFFTNVLNAQLMVNIGDHWSPTKIKLWREMKLTCCKLQTMLASMVYRMISVHKISADDPDPFRKSIDQYDR